MNVWQVFFGGSWMIEDAILALVILTLTLCFGIMGYLININNRISKVERMIHRYIEWHRGKNSGKN